MSYCQVGDSPTVYYKFKGYKDYAKVGFRGLSPIEIQTEDLSTSTGGTSGSTSDGSDSSTGSYYPCPPIGSTCTLIYSGEFRYGDNYGFDPGQCHRYSYEGFSIEECYLYSAYGDNPDAEFNYFDFAFYWSLKATRSYKYQKGVARPNPPSNYDEYVIDENGLFSSYWTVTSDSCFPKGGDSLTCSDSPPPSPSPSPSPSPPPEDEKLVKLNVLHNQIIIWSQTGEPPLTYEVSCSKDECPPGMMKLKNSQGFCCIKCEDIRSELKAIKSILRQK